MAELLAHAVEMGYSEIEEVKRYTGFGTGPCQGKECMALVACTIAKLSGTAPEGVAPFTTRPPLGPISLGTLAQVKDR